MKSWIIGLILPTIVSSLSSVIFEYLQKAISWIDNLSGQTKVIVMGAVSIILPLLAKSIPGFPDTLAGFDATTVTALVGLIVNQLTHKALNPLPPDPTKK